MTRLFWILTGALLWASLAGTALAQTPIPGQQTTPAPDPSALAPQASTIANGVDAGREAEALTRPCGGYWGQLFGGLIILAMLEPRRGHEARAADCLERLFVDHAATPEDAARVRRAHDEAVQAASGGRPLAAAGGAGPAPGGGAPPTGDPNAPKPNPPPPDPARCAELVAQALEDATADDARLVARGRARLRLLAAWVTSPRRPGRD